MQMYLEKGNMASTAILEQTVQSPSSGIKTNTAGNAVDGNHTTCSRTGVGGGTRWLRIGLQSQAYMIGMIIKITESEISHFRGFSIEIGNITTQDPFSLCYTHGNTNGEEVIEVNCVRPLVGQYIRISLAEGETRDLALCEVEIYGGRLVSFNRQTSMSSIYIYDSPWNSSYGVDGKTNSDGVQQVDLDTRTCSATNPNYNGTNHHWWRVDLSIAFNIQSVSFFGRQDKPSINNQYEGFGVSSSEDGSSFTEIFKDSLTNRLDGYLYQPKSRNLTWPIKSRSIQVNRMAFILVVCEVEVFGECPIELCGWECNEKCKCSSQTTGTNKIFGTCPHGCAGRWTGLGGKCNRECDINHWGPTCIQKCGHCVTPCNAANGTCPTSCHPGWQLPYCLQACAAGFYGPLCSMECGHCKNGRPCDPQTGHCRQCEEGYTGEFCTKVCIDGRYGQECSRCCGNCAGNETCNRTTGICPFGCLPKFTGGRCDQEIASALSDTTNTGTTGLIVAVVVVCLVVIAATIVNGIIFYKRRSVSAKTKTMYATSFVSATRQNDDVTNYDVVISPSAANSYEGYANVQTGQ